MKVRRHQWAESCGTSPLNGRCGYSWRHCARGGEGQLRLPLRARALRRSPRSRSISRAPIGAGRGWRRRFAGGRHRDGRRGCSEAGRQCSVVEQVGARARIRVHLTLHCAAGVAVVVESGKHHGPGPLISTRVPVKTTSANSYASVSVKAAQSQAAARCGVPRVNAPDVTTAHSSAMFTTAAIRDLTTPSRTTRTNYKFPGATNENPPVGCEAHPLAVRCRSPVGRGGQFAARRSLWPVLRAIDRLGAQPPWCRTCSTPLVPPMPRRAGGTLR